MSPLHPQPPQHQAGCYLPPGLPGDVGAESFSPPWPVLQPGAGAAPTLPQNNLLQARGQRELEAFSLLYRDMRTSGTSPPQKSHNTQLGAAAPWLSTFLNRVPIQRGAPFPPPALPSHHVLPLPEPEVSQCPWHRPPPQLLGTGNPPVSCPWGADPRGAGPRCARGGRLGSPRQRAWRKPVWIGAHKAVCFPY